jgi:hypothetical protein
MSAPAVNLMNVMSVPIASTAHASRAFDDVERRYRRIIQRTAIKLSRGDDTLADELEQAGLEALWELDPSRVAPADDMILLIRIRDRMKNRRKMRYRAERNDPERGVSERALARLEAEVAEPAYMRRARGEVWDPQDPCTEHL